MPQIDYDKRAASSNSLIKISRSTGIDNFSRTSKIRAISEIVSEDISIYTDISTDIMNNMYSTSAEGRYLDLKGSEFGVYRNTIDSIDIKSVDNIIRLKPRDENTSFSEIFGSVRNIYKFEEIDLGSNFKLVITENTQVTPQSSEVFLSGRVVSIDRDTGIQINEGDTFKVPDTMLDISFEASSLQIVFDKPISLEVGSESDEDFRPRVIFARDNSKFGVSGSIIRSLYEVNGLSGSTVYMDERGSGSVDVGIITQKLAAGEEDQSIDSIKRMVEYRLRSVVAEGIDYQVFIPEELKLIVTFTYESDVAIPDQTIIDTIYQAIENINIYGTVGVISASAIEKEADSILDSIASIDIKTLSLLDTQIEEYISFGASSVVAPKGMFISINKSDIEKA